MRELVIGILLFGLILVLCNKSISLNEELKAANKTLADIAAAPVPLYKNIKNGDIAVLVPYRTEPLMYKGVCSPEGSL